YNEVLFPEEQFTYTDKALGILLSDITKTRTRPRFQLWFYGCVRYAGSSQKTFQTDFAYRVVHIGADPTGQGLVEFLDFKFGEPIPADMLRLEVRPTAANSTN